MGALLNSKRNAEGGIDGFHFGVLNLPGNDEINPAFLWVIFRYPVDLVEFAALHGRKLPFATRLWILDSSRTSAEGGSLHMGFSRSKGKDNRSRRYFAGYVNGQPVAVRNFYCLGHGHVEKHSMKTE